MQLETVPGSLVSEMVSASKSPVFAYALPPSHEIHPSDGILPPSHLADLKSSTRFYALSVPGYLVLTRLNQSSFFCFPFFCFEKRSLLSIHTAQNFPPTAMTFPVFLGG